MTFFEKFCKKRQIVKSRSRIFRCSIGLRGYSLSTTSLHSELGTLTVRAFTESTSVIANLGKLPRCETSQSSVLRNFCSNGLYIFVTQVTK